MEETKASDKVAFGESDISEKKTKREDVQLCKYGNSVSHIVAVDQKNDL